MSCSIVRLKQNDTRSNWFLKFILYKYTIAYVLRLRAVSICIMYIYIYIFIYLVTFVCEVRVQRRRVSSQLPMRTLWQQKRDMDKKYGVTSGKEG